MRLVSFLLLGILLTYSGCSSPESETKPKIAFTFDDGSTKNILSYELVEWNQLILDNLDKHHAKAVFFITGSQLDREKGKYVLESWNNAGHKIGNHTYSHPNFNNVDVTPEQFKYEILKNDSLIRTYDNYFPYFRFPFLKAGNTSFKRDEIRKFLKTINYKHGYVSIDASDWYINSRLIRRLKKDANADILPFKKFYIEHIYERALYYDSLALELTNTRVNHTLLLHHNLTSALFLDDLIQHFKNKGWEIIDADVAYDDQIFELEPITIPAGESIIWSLAKESGRYDDILRYPAEDSRYEKIKMDSLYL